MKVKLAISQNDYDEWVVKYYLNNSFSEGKSYYTDDLEDAIGTARHMEREAENQGHIVTTNLARYAQNPWDCLSRNPDDELPIYEIPEANWAKLEASIADLNNKAVKLGSTPVVLSIIDERQVTKKDGEDTWTEIVYHVTVTGEAPKLSGWGLIAVITPQISGENLVKCIPGKVCPTKYRLADPKDCDHCNTQRRRNDVFILRHDNGEHRQVGRQCLRDFLGHKDPSRILSMAEILMSVGDIMHDAEEGGWGGGFRSPTYNLQQFVATTACVVRRLGWVPKSKAEHGHPSTASNVLEILVPPFGAQAARSRRLWVAENQLYVNEEDEKLAEDAIQWGQALPTDGGDYIYNLGVSIRNGVVEAGNKNSTVGLVASLVSAYNREIKKERDILRRAQKAENTVHVGTPKVRQGFPGVTVVFIGETRQTQYGISTLIKLEDSDGNNLTWWNTSEVAKWLKDSYQDDTPIDITATVKKHEDYRGVPQTVIQRVKEGLPKKKAAKGGARKCGLCKQTGHNRRSCPDKSRKLRRRKS